MCGNKDVLARMPPFAPPSGRGLTKGTCEVFGGKPNGHMRMLTGASQRLAKRHSATVRSPAPSHTWSMVNAAYWEPADCGKKLLRVMQA